MIFRSEISEEIAGFFLLTINKPKNNNNDKNKSIKIINKTKMELV